MAILTPASQREAVAWEEAAVRGAVPRKAHLEAAVGARPWRLAQEETVLRLGDRVVPVADPRKAAVRTRSRRLAHEGATETGDPVAAEALPPAAREIGLGNRAKIGGGEALLKSGIRTVEDAEGGLSFTAKQLHPQARRLRAVAFRRVRLLRVFPAIRASTSVQRWAHISKRQFVS